MKLSSRQCGVRYPLPVVAGILIWIASGSLTWAQNTNVFKNTSASTGWNSNGYWSLGHQPQAGDALLWISNLSNLYRTDTVLNGNYGGDSLSYDSASTFYVRSGSSGAPTYTLTLDGTNTTGNANETVNASGTLDVISVKGGATVNLGVGSLTSGNGVLTIALGNAPTDSIFVDTSSSLIFGWNGNSGAIVSGAGKDLSFHGSGTLTFDGPNTFGGAGNSFTLNSGYLNLNTNAALGNANNTFIINGGTIDNSSGKAVTLNNYAQQWNSNFTYTGTQNLNLGNGAVSLGKSVQLNVMAQTLTVGGAISDGSAGYGLTKAGGGTLLLTGINTYSGATIVSNGTLGAGANFVISTHSALQAMAGATFTNNFQQAVGSIAGAGNIILGASGVLSNGFDDTTTTFSGTISGAGSLHKYGSGTLTLSGTDNYTGSTLIQAGTLLVNGTLSNGAGVFVNAGAALGGTGVVSEAVTLQSGATLTPGSGLGAGVLTFTSSLTLSNNFAYQWDLGTTSTDRLDVAALTLAGGFSTWTLELGTEGQPAMNFSGINATNNVFVLMQATSGSLPVALTNNFVLQPGIWMTNQDTQVYFNSDHTQLLLTGVYLIPEPNVLILWLAGALTLLAARRRRRGSV